MTIKVGNAPCSWGVEFADDERNPAWKTVLKECAEVGFKGIELGPVGYMPEASQEFDDGLAEFDLELTGGVVFQPIHDPSSWDRVLDATHRVGKSLQIHCAKHMVLIDSISQRRAATAGRAYEAEQMGVKEWNSFVNRIRDLAKIGREEYGLTVSIHAHAAGFIDFEPELERLLGEIDESDLKICLDTGHHSYAGFDPVAFLEKHIERISYMHLKDIDPVVKADTIANRRDFYDACGRGIFCNLGKGDVDFSAVRSVLVENRFEGWCTIEQECDPVGDTTPINDAFKNREFLQSIGFN